MKIIENLSVCVLNSVVALIDAFNVSLASQCSRSNPVAKLLYRFDLISDNWSRAFFRTIRRRVIRQVALIGQTLG